MSNQQNCWVAKALMSHTFFVKFRVLKTILPIEYLVYQAQIPREG